VGEDVDLGLEAGGVEFRDAGDLSGLARLVKVGQGARAAAFADIENLGVAGINVGVDVVAKFGGYFGADAQRILGRRFHSSVLKG
jgi:hypothetical protein